MKDRLVKLLFSDTAKDVKSDVGAIKYFYFFQKNETLTLCCKTHFFPLVCFESFLSFVRIFDHGGREVGFFFPVVHGFIGFGLLVTLKHKPAREVVSITRVCHELPLQISFIFFTGFGFSLENSDKRNVISSNLKNLFSSRSHSFKIKNRMAAPGISNIDDSYDYSKHTI